MTVSYDKAIWGGRSVTEWLRARAPEVFGSASHFTRMMRQHGLVPFVVADTPADDRPESRWIESLRGWWAYELRDNLRRTGELVSLMRSLEEAQLHPLVLKGPVLAQLTHGHVALRMFGDLDLVVRPEEALDAIVHLQRRGYQPKMTLTGTQLAMHLRTAYHLGFVHTQTRDSVELHWHMVPTVLLSVFDERRAWARQQRVAIGGYPVATLSPEDTVHFLVVHGAKHRWRRLSWMYDFARLSVVQADLDWPALLAEAAECGSDRMLVLAQALALGLRGLPPADDDPAVVNLVQEVRQHLWDYWTTGDDDDRGFQLAALHRLRDKARYGASWIFEPTHKDLAAVTLPPHWQSLYYAIRPLRLLRDRTLGA